METELSAFCGSSGGIVKQVFPTTAGAAFAIAGYGASGLLMQYYPTLAKPVAELVEGDRASEAG